MSFLSKFNPHSQSYVSQGRDGRFENKPVTNRGIVNNAPRQQPELKVLSQKAPETATTKIVY